MKIKELFELMENPLYLANVGLYFGSDCEDALEMIADELVAKYGNKEILDFNVETISITVYNSKE